MKQINEKRKKKKKKEKPHYTKDPINNRADERVIHSGCQVPIRQPSRPACGRTGLVPEHAESPVIKINE